MGLLAPSFLTGGGFFRAIDIEPIHRIAEPHETSISFNDIKYQRTSEGGEQSTTTKRRTYTPLFMDVADNEVVYLHTPLHEASSP